MRFKEEKILKDNERVVFRYGGWELIIFVCSMGRVVKQLSHGAYKKHNELRRVPGAAPGAPTILNETMT